ncbi:MAG: type I-E CRISPR-associated protein Cse2/CasB [Armatimonadetes bacterium]|jgi:CRISPR type I-E-associated protein CasB/Cse2|nr:type I-E CRISPR-associated protein Cse2/CasB [Armatimonadota bacterium]
MNNIATDTKDQQPTEGLPGWLVKSTAYLNELRKQADTGRWAMLRRGAGKALSEARDIHWIYGLLDRFAKPHDEEAYFLVATLIAFDKTFTQQDASGRAFTFTGNIGRTMRALKVGKPDTAQQSFDRRFGILLNADFDPQLGGELAFRLRQCVKRIIAERNSAIAINWPQLLADILDWNNENKRVQKSWARAYYTTNTPADSKSENESQEQITQGN